MRRPFVTLKLATSLDGKIALANGQSEWITGEKSRQKGRLLRAEHDAIVVGANTAVLDNPQLTTRIDGQPDPIRVIFDTTLRLSPESNLARTATLTPVWIFTRDSSGAKAKALEELGVRLFEVPCSDKVEAVTALQALKTNGVNSLLLEGGGTLAASFIQCDAIDRIEWFRAPILLGGDGRSGIGALNMQDLNLAMRFNRIDVSELGDDLHERYERVR